MPDLKTIGKSGQIALGKEHAGRPAVVEQVEPGVWVIKLGRFVPDNERWLDEEATRATLERAVRWAENEPPRESRLDVAPGREAL